MQLIDIIFQAYLTWESWSKKDDFSQFSFHSPFPRSWPTVLSLAFAQRFSEVFHMSPKVPWKPLGAPLKWRGSWRSGEGVGVYGALGLPCFNQSCSMYWGWKSLKLLLWPLSYILKHLSCCPSPPKRHVGNDFSKMMSPSSWALTPKHPAQCFVPSRSVCSGYLGLIWLIDWLLRWY